jgi:hypothetical protein
MLVLRGRTRLVGIAAVLTVAALLGGGCSAADVAWSSTWLRERPGPTL